MGEWSTPDVVAARLRPRWRTGALLTAYAAGSPFPVLDIPVRGPRAGELGADLAAVQRWTQGWERAASGQFELVRRAVGTRTIGASRLPARAVVSSWEQAWRLLGVEAEVRTFDEVLALVTDDDPRLVAWVVAHPHAALAVPVTEWPAIVAALEWLTAARGSGRHVREVSAPGVDTKLIERRRSLLAAVLDLPSGAEDFAAALGLAVRPARVRLRLGHRLRDGPLSDVTAPVSELASLRLDVSSAVVVENEISFLAAPVPADGVVLFGEGFRVSRAGALPWLADVPVHYWGDLDTHGFAILDRLRAWLPQTSSFLMDRDTLLAHRDRWGVEPTPTAAGLPRLTAAEASVYEDLVTDRYADRVRLEQERIDWSWVRERWPVSV